MCCWKQSLFSGMLVGNNSLKFKLKYTEHTEKYRLLSVVYRLSDCKLVIE